MSDGRRVLVATDHRRCATAVLDDAAGLAGADGEVVLAAVLVVPLDQPIDAALDRAVDDAGTVLEAGERRRLPVRAFDTRLVRARSFADGVDRLLEEERFDILVLQRVCGVVHTGLERQQEALVERAGLTVALIRPAEPAIT
ncbi:MAG: hypothetical protein QOD86_1456 [Miltoncostaeaceae bacterium]|jgi:hypothetical protein|nr:hypothetical protein [Miltoncostaeaceae bacterium]